MSIRCRNCEAEVVGLVCNQCGTYVAMNHDKESELTILEEYHKSLREVTHPAAIVPFLENGFLPQHPEALIEAGFRCLPMIQSGDANKAKAAQQRLETIISKLKVMSSPKLTTQPITEFETKLKEAKDQARANDYFYTSCFSLIFLTIIGLCGLGIYGLNGWVY